MRNLLVLFAQIDPRRLVRDGDQKDYPGSLRAYRLAKSENDDSLIFANDLDSGKDYNQYDDKYDRQNAQRKHKSIHREASMV
jgi:hypothetical protein